MPFGDCGRLLVIASESLNLEHMSAKKLILLITHVTRNHNRQIAIDNDKTLELHIRVMTILFQVCTCLRKIQHKIILVTKCSCLSYVSYATCNKRCVFNHLKFLERKSVSEFDMVFQNSQ